VSSAGGPLSVTGCIDLSGLAAPEPLERVLDWLDAAAPGATGAFLLPRVPYPLFDHLARRPCDWETREQPDGRAVVIITRRAGA
jgi:Uncharacterized conserved protein (DUF2249)